MSENVSLSDLLLRGGLYEGITGNTPEEIYANLSKQVSLPQDMSADVFYNALCAREKVLTTAVGNGVAMPHARTPVLKRPEDECVAICYLEKPIDMGAPDGRGVYVMFVLMTCSPQSHLRTISQLARFLQKKEFRQALENHASLSEIVTLLHTL
ncbi:MAG: PTS sugar transporter subunit IIA [Treponema sp.]|nr:PTS sugar transporter subunit IIA [Treponema sp.]